MLPYLQQLESESIYILREAAAQFEKLAMLYSLGKDSSVLLRLAQKAFYPGKIPFPLLHVDTGYKFPEMYEFRDKVVQKEGIQLIVYRNEEAISRRTHPKEVGISRCCEQLKTRALLDALKSYGFTAAIGGARRDEEPSRAKERIFSLRDSFGRWDPRQQRPELWNLYNGKVAPGDSMRIFPLSNWTELNIWQYILLEDIPLVPLYFAKPRPMIVRGQQLIPAASFTTDGEASEEVMCRFRTLGCMPCTGAVRSYAATVPEILEELKGNRVSERATRLIDHDQEGSMELKKREGYF